jgi:hypothetical protein
MRGIPMSDTNTPTRPQTLEAIMNRVSMPMLLFSGVLFGLLLLSYTLLLPRFTQLHRADGMAMSPREIARYQRQLAASLTEQEEHRVRLVLPVNDEHYTELKTKKQGTLSLTDLREQLMQAASRAGENADVVQLTKLSIEGNSVSVEGDIRNTGTRSMTVLAAYIEEVAKLPIAADLVRPPFTRVALPDGSYHSPFKFTFTVAAK